MTLFQFVRHVNVMRRLQKAYSYPGDIPPAYLSDAEAVVDRAIKEILCDSTVYIMQTDEVKEPQ